MVSVGGGASDLRGVERAMIATVCSRGIAEKTRWFRAQRACACAEEGASRARAMARTECARMRGD